MPLLGQVMTDPGYPSPRIVARLDVKGGKLIKGKSFEGVRVIGNAIEAAFEAERAGFDELFLLDSVASLYDRAPQWMLLCEALSEIQIPVCVGGGITSLADVERVFDLGAEKVCINTGVIKAPELIQKIASVFGSQAICVSVQASQNFENRFLPAFHCGREVMNMPLQDWIRRVIDLGAGEVFLTSVSRDGQDRGYDHALVRSLGSLNFAVPVVYSGGVRSNKDIEDLTACGFDAVAVGTRYHAGEFEPYMSQRNRLGDAVAEAKAL